MRNIHSICNKLLGLGLCGGFLGYSSAYAACTTTANSIVANGGSTCTVVGGSYTPTVGWANFMTVGESTSTNGGALSITGDMDVSITPNSSYAQFGVGGIAVAGVHPSLPGLASQVNAQNVRLDMRSGPAGVSKTGLGVVTAGNYTGKDFTAYIAINNQSPLFGGYNTNNYGILAGNSVDSTAGIPAARKPHFQFATVTLDNASISIDTTASSTFGAYRNTSSGIRAISVAAAGTDGYVNIKGQTTITTKGRYSTGLYISGGDSQVHMNHSTIKTAGATSNVLKLGKIRDTGTGRAQLYSTGTIDWESTDATTPAILLLGDRTLLEAADAASKGSVKSAAQAILFGNNDLDTQSLADGTQVNFNNTSFSSTPSTAALFQVNAGQTNATLSLQGADSVAQAPSNGWLMQVDNASSVNGSLAAASATLNATGGAQLTGLTTKGATQSDLTVTLQDSATWTLASKGTTTTATLTQLTMATASTLNANAAGTGNFTMAGSVSSNASTVNLQDATAAAGDVFTIQGNYSGTGAFLKLDTCLGDSTAASDKLVITGNSSGNTTLHIASTSGATCAGALTTGNGIEVVQVGGTSAATFTLAGGSITQGNYRYSLAKVGNNWYLQSTLLPATTAQIKVTEAISAPPGLQPYTATISFALNCTDASLNQNGSVTLVNGVGESSPITVPVGSNCQVIEALPVPPTGYRWATGSETKSTGTLAAGASKIVAFSDSLLRGAGAGTGAQAIPANNPWALALLSLGILLPWGAKRCSKRKAVH